MRTNACAVLHRESEDTRGPIHNPQESTNCTSVGEFYLGVLVRSNGITAPSTKLVLDFSNIRGLYNNLDVVHHQIETAKLALLFLTETQISSPVDTSCLSYPRYGLEHCSMSKAEVCVHVRDNISSRREFQIWRARIPHLTSHPDGCL